MWNSIVSVPDHCLFICFVWEFLLALADLLLKPRHDKTCLREFPTRPDTNWPAQPQKLARVLKFRL